MLFAATGGKIIMERFPPQAPGWNLQSLRRDRKGREADVSGRRGAFPGLVAVCVKLREQRKLGEIQGGQSRGQAARGSGEPAGAETTAGFYAHTSSDA